MIGTPLFSDGTEFSVTTRAGTPVFPQCQSEAKRLPEWRNRARVVAMSDLRSQIKGLSTDEKVELLDAVWESLEMDAMSLTEAQRAELDYRIARHEQNPSDVVPWEQVRAGLFKKP
jgi:putative addiction module component (TIGR02574 family)